MSENLSKEDEALFMWAMSAKPGVHDDKKVILIDTSAMDMHSIPLVEARKKLPEDQRYTKDNFWESYLFGYSRGYMQVLYEQGKLDKDARYRIILKP